MAKVQGVAFCFLALSLGVRAFAGEQAPVTAVAEHARLQREFAGAAQEFQVPLRLLQSIGYTESRWHQRIPAETPENDRPPAYGVMGLRDDFWFGHSLESAAKLIGKTKLDLIVASSENIRGAAAYLRSLALQAKGTANEIPRSALSAESGDLLPWMGVLESYSGIPQKEHARAYALSVFKAARAGLHRNGIEIESAPALIAPLDAAAPGQAQYPDAHWSASQNFDTRPIHPTYVIIHVTEGNFDGSVSWLRSPYSKASAHYVIRSQDGYIAQLVSEENVAWHARCWNPLAIGVEHEGFSDTGEDFTSAMYASSAALVRYLADKYSIPVDPQHIIGHNFWQTQDFKNQDVLQNCNDHVDPGALWDWTGYFTLLQPGQQPADQQDPQSGSQLR